VTSIADSYRSQSWSQRILRVWLGVTFIYAGWNKASDATFFKRGSTHFIGSQLIGFSHGSPLRPLLLLASHQAILVGWLTILTEMAIGIAILLNVASLPAAIAGGFFSLTLWLSSSWRVRPYFLASDPAYFVMWCAYAAALVQQMKITLLNPVIGRKRALASTRTDLQRRQVVRIGAVGLLALVGGLLGRLFQSSPTSRKKSASGTRSAINGGTVLATLASLPVGTAVNFTAKNGDPAVLIRTSTSKVAAFDAVCTHQGCTVAYDKPSQSLICPCHLSQFDPLAHAAVLAGPAPAPLSEIGVKIDGSNIVLT
jgi:thiosulfate dehydrogenase [quinone] large subunit